MKLFATYAAACSLLIIGCSTPAGRIARPAPVSYSQPAPVNEVQDAAFWIHPIDPSRSLLLVTNEHRGLEVHDLNGVLLKHLDEDVQPQYVDVLYNIATASGVRDLVFASCQGDLAHGVKVWGVDTEKAKLVAVNGQATLKVLGDLDPLGLFGYRHKDGRAFLFVTSGDGTIEQHEIVPAHVGDGVELKLVRTLKVNGKSKGGVADIDRDVIFIDEDKVGIWQFAASPEGSTEGTLIIRAGQNGLVPNVRGPGLYRASDGNGYLLVGGQGKKGNAAVVHVYERVAPYRHLMSIEPAAGRFGVPEHSSGLDVSSATTSPAFPGGVFALNDQQNENGSEDFKLYAWRDIAEQGKLEWQKGMSPREYWHGTK